MKKLMTAFAACMMAGFVSAQITSLNIVGYQTFSAPQGFSAYAAPLITVGSLSTVGKLSAIQGTFADFDQIQILNADGNYTTLCSWLTVVGFGVPADGWYDDTLTPVEITDLPQGGSVVLSTSAPVEVLNIGEVNTDPVVVNLVAGFAAAGNGTPTTRMLSAFAFGGGIADFDQIQLLNADGNYTTLCSWLTVAGFGVPADGWYDDTLTPVDRSIAAGEGFVLSTGAGCTMTIPSPLVL